MSPEGDSPLAPGVSPGLRNARTSSPGGAKDSQRSVESGAPPGLESFHIDTPGSRPGLEDCRPPGSAAPGSTRLTLFPTTPASEAFAQTPNASLTNRSTAASIPAATGTPASP